MGAPDEEEQRWCQEHLCSMQRSLSSCWLRVDREQGSPAFPTHPKAGTGSQITEPRMKEGRVSERQATSKVTDIERRYTSPCAQCTAGLVLSH